jgi:phosphotransferase system enzyme I (PtsP)
MGIDGDRGRVYVNPSQKTVRGLRRSIEGRRARSADLEGLRDLPARTRDGVTVPLQANIGLPSDIHVAIASGAEGIGLYRTEYQFLMSEGFPVEEEQYTSYLDVLEAFAPSPVTIRTLDVGGDKILSYFSVTEDNPFLGSRGVRFSLSHPEIFQIQLRALLRANAVHGNLRILFPMIARVSEADAVRKLLERSHSELLEEGQASVMPSVGVMIEVPSAVFLTKTLAARVDFLSVGSNDLAQYILAADRTNPEVADRDDTLHPAVLHAIRQVILDGHRCGKPVSACGEMAGDPVGAVLLLGMGADALSMSAPALTSVKRAIRSVTAARARTLVRKSLLLQDGSEVRELLTGALRNELA